MATNTGKCIRKILKKQYSWFSQALFSIPVVYIEQAKIKNILIVLREQEEDKKENKNE